MSPSTAPAAAERAYASLREAILGGARSPGTMLSEAELARELGMSRTPVRAALQRLQDEGWITVYPQRGALVRDLTDDELREAAEVRHALESAGVQTATPARRQEVRERLTGNLQEQELALAQGDVPTFARLALAFHRGFAEMADNATSLEIYDRMHARQLVSITRSAPRLTGEPGEVVADHTRLLDLAGAGDWVGFTTHLAAHRAAHEAAEGGRAGPAHRTG